MKILILTVLMCLILTQIVFAQEVDQIIVKGKMIRVGQLWDDLVPFMNKLKKYRKGYKVMFSDPSKPYAGNVVSSKASYQIDNKKFSLFFARKDNVGPFIVSKIITE